MANCECGNEDLDGAFCSNCGKSLVHLSSNDKTLSDETAKLGEQSTASGLTVLANEASKAKSRKAGLVAIPVAAILGIGGFLILQQQAQAQLETDAQTMFNVRKLAVDSLFRRTATNCGAGNSFGVEYDKKYMTLDTAGDDDWLGADTVDVACILYATDIPDTVVARVDNTSALQGVVSGNWETLDGWGTIYADWTYHPDTGLVMGLEIRSVYQETFDFEKHYPLLKADLEADK